MESQIGCKSNGLGTDVLFDNGIPRMETMNTLLKSIDEQLGDTNRQIEACVKSILDMSNGMLSSEIPRYYHPGEAVKNINEKHLLEKTACYDPDPEEITKLLRHILETLASTAGCEEVILQQILHLTSQEGFSLPLQSTGCSPMDHSVMSINTAVHDSESINEALWNEICLKLRKYFFEKLQNLNNSPVLPTINLVAQKRLQYVQSLCSLYNAKDIWGKYRSIRSQQYGEKLLTYGISNLSTSENIKFEKGVQHFESLVLITQVMIQDDFALFNSGIFGSVISTMDALQEIYLDKIVDDIGLIVESLQIDLTQVVTKLPTSKKGRETDGKPFPKSTSEAASLNQNRENLRKQQSKSLDSLLSREDNFTDLHSLPADVIGMLVRFIICVLNLDNYVQELHSMLTWEISHMSAKKQQHKRLKSALRSRKEPEKLHSMSRPLFLPSDSDIEASGTFGTNNIPSGVPSQAMMAEMTSSLRVVEKQSPEKKHLDWKLAFNKVSVDLARCVEQKFLIVSEKIMEYDADRLEKTNRYEMVLVRENLKGGRFDYPVKISKGVDELFQEVDAMLVLAKAFSVGALQIIHTSFVDSLAVAIKNMYTKISKVMRLAFQNILQDRVRTQYGIPGKITNEVLQIYPCEVWYQCLSNSAFIRNQLLYFDSVLTVDEQGNTKKTLNNLYKKFCELCESISSQVIAYQQTLLSISILQDAESHNWEDLKDFFEDERCSFDIQMWNLHMKGLQHDLWSNCPPMAAQNIYSRTLQDSLYLFEQRYSAVKPSYRRTKQVKFDITAILFCTMELLTPASSNIDGYLDPNSNQKMIYSIHNSCCTLLSVVAIVTSPLECLYKVFKKGFKRRHSRNGEAQLKLYMSHWMSWIQPAIFPLGKDCMEDFQTTTALYLQLKILFAQPDIKWGLFLESLLMKDYTLAIMLLTQTAQHTSSEGANKSEVYSKNNVDAADAKGDSNVMNIFSDFVGIFLHMASFPEGLTKVMLPVFERTNTWDLLDNTTILGRSHTIPPWIQVLLNCLQKFVKRALEAGIKVLVLKAESENKEEVEPIINSIEDLPCGCPFSKLKSAETPRKTSLSDDLQGFSLEEEIGLPITEHKEVMAEAIYSVLMQMNDDIYMLPTPMIMLFKAMQDQINQKGHHSPHNCVAIKLLATCLRGTLIDTDLIESWLGSPLSDEMKDQMRMLAECTYHVLTATSCGKSSGVPRIASTFMKANRNWLSEQIELLSDHFSNDIFEVPESPGPLYGATEDYIEQLMVSELSLIQSTPNGYQQLWNCYGLVENNCNWIINQLDIPQLIGSFERIENIGFNLSPVRKEKPSFNPLKEYQTIGNRKFDQVILGNFEYNWMSLLQSDLGLSEIGMKNLLFHRHEMQEGAFLEETEKKPVEILKKKFDSENSDVVLV